MSDLEKRFAAAQAAAESLRDRTDDDTLLELHSYLMQASEGDVIGDRMISAPGEVRRLGGAQGHEARCCRARLRQARGEPAVTRELTVGMYVEGLT